MLSKPSRAEGARAVPIRTRFASGPLPAPMAVRIVVVGAWMDDPSRIDHGRGRDDHRRGRDHRRLADHNGGRRHDGGLGNHSRGWCHDRGLSDHNGIGRYDIMRERNRRRRQSDNARREAEPAAVVVVVMSSREYARSGCQRKSHNKDFLRVHDLPRLSVSVEHHRPT